MRELATDRASPQVAQLGGFLLHRTLHLVRSASRSEIEAEQLALARFLQTEAVRTLRSERADIVGGWEALAELLSESARRSDRAAWTAILSDDNGLGLRLLEFLAMRSQPVPRKAILPYLRVSETHLSHLLRALDEADLIMRHRGKANQVEVELTNVGQEAVRARLLPPWVEDACKMILDPAAGRSTAAVIRRLTESGATRLTAERLAAAILSPRGNEKPPAPRRPTAARGDSDSILRHIGSGTVGWSKAT